MRTRISAASVEYIGAPVSEATGLTITQDTVALAIVPDGSPPTVWTTGVWKTVQGRSWPVVLIGPGTTVGPLAPGRYRVHIRVTDSPEIPVLTAPNTITIY